MDLPYPKNFTRIFPSKEALIEPIDTETKLILAEADRQGISWEIIQNTDAISLTKNGVSHFIRSRTPSGTNALSLRVCQNKPFTKSFLQRAGINTPKGYTIYRTDSEDIIRDAWESIQKPIVFKPTHGTHGNNIIIGITTIEECLLLIKNYFSDPKYEGGVVLEEMFTGRECRIVANRNKVIAAMERVPAYVIGDGKSSIQELIENKNAVPARNISQDLYPHIKIDDDLVRNIKKSGFELESVPSDREKVVLRTVSNIMAGGEAIDRTDELHSDVIDIALRTVNAIPGLTWAGIDFMSTDLFAPQTQDSYCIIELGVMPEFAMHDIPMQGKKRGVALEFLKLMFPDLLDKS